jgi:hypothetical protein
MKAAVKSVNGRSLPKFTVTPDVPPEFVERVKSWVLSKKRWGRHVVVNMFAARGGTLRVQAAYGKTRRPRPRNPVLFDEVMLLTDDPALAEKRRMTLRALAK